MTGELINHLWQSTLYAVTAGLLTVAFRENRAQIRYWLWFSASLKFFIPFALLIALGSHSGLLPAGRTLATPIVSSTVEQIAEPYSDVSTFAAPASTIFNWSSSLILSLWMCGFGWIVLLRLRSWLRIRAAIGSSIPLKLSSAVEARSSQSLLEPGVVGLWRPILLLPVGIVERLTPLQLEAVLAHEACHVRRRDNLTAAIHMIVEAIFWFHPLVWWISARLVEERERACDEDVLRLGSEPHIYAEAIVSVCKYYLESPLACVSGVTGSDLKRRIETIMARHIAQNLNIARKFLLAMGGLAAVAAPIIVGLLNAPTSTAQQPFQYKEFNAVSIKPSAPDDHNSFMLRPEPGGFSALGVPLKMLVMEAYNVNAFQISGGPNWMGTERWDILAKTNGVDQIGMAKFRPMLQTVLEERFRLKIHIETKDVPVFALEAETNGAKLVPHTGTEQQFRPRQGSLVVKKGTVGRLALWLSRELGRVVIDATGLKGEYDYALQWTPDPGQGGPESIGLAPDTRGAPATGAYGPSIFTAIQEQLGLRLVSQNGKVEFVVIDGADRPSVN